MDRNAGGAGLSRRETLALLAGLGVGAAGLPGGAEAAPQRKFNVLWLMTDEHSPFVAGYAGDRVARTPTIDALAKDGVQFSAAYTPNPICVPARQGFHSGRMGSNLDFAAQNYEALGSYFKRMGYRTAWFGKQHWLELVNNFDEVGEKCEDVTKRRFEAAGLPLPNGSRRVEDANVSYWGEECNDDTVCTEQALDFLGRVSAEKPFFLGVSLEKPHFPFTIQQKFYDRFAGAVIPQPVVTQQMLRDLSAANKNDRDRYELGALTAAQQDFCRKIYYGMVNYADEQLGKVVSLLEQRGLRDNTIIVYMADHGELMGQHGLWYKNSFFEGAARVPMIVWLPPALRALRVKTNVSAPVSTLDLFPTLCELNGLRPVSSLEGTSLVSLMAGVESGRNRMAFSENRRYRVAARMIRTPEYKYCWYEDGFEQMYDMVGADRTMEAVNLAPMPKYAKEKKRLKDLALDGWNKDGLIDHGDA